MPLEVAMLVDAIANRNAFGVAVSVGCLVWRAHRAWKGFVL